MNFKKLFSIHIHFSHDECVKGCILDHPIIRSISLLLAPLQRSTHDYHVPIRFKPGGERKKERKVYAGGYIYICICIHTHTYAYSHLSSDRNDLNARETPEKCRCARTYRTTNHTMIYSSWHREICAWDPQTEYSMAKSCVRLSYITHRYS